MTGNSKAWLGQFGELGHPYTHPTSKQCNYSYTHPSSQQCMHNHDSVYSKLGHVHDSLCQIQVGSYKGAGTYGSSNKCSLTFEFTPVLWGLNMIIRPSANDAMANAVSIFTWGITCDDGFSVRTTWLNNSTMNVSYDGNTVYYWSNNATNQWNDSAYYYYWFAIG